MAPPRPWPIAYRPNAAAAGSWRRSRSRMERVGLKYDTAPFTADRANDREQRPMSRQVALGQPRSVTALQLDGIALSKNLLVRSLLEGTAGDVLGECS